jgi:hypothetical protein
MARSLPVVSIADLRALKKFEMTQDVAAYWDAKTTDDGGRGTPRTLPGYPS